MARPVTDFWISVLGRPLVLLAWGLFAWGTLMALVLVWDVIASGFETTLARLSPDAEHGAWGVVNLALALLATALWGTIGFLHVRRRAGEEEQEDRT